MFRLSGRRFGTTVLVVLALLFSQLALASYICPPAGGPQPAMLEMADGEPCGGMAADPAQPVLCHQHCNGAPQSADAAKVPTVSLPAILHVVVLPVAGDAAERHAVLAGDTGPPQPPPEPVFLSTLRLRV
jgi:hypothetical protein